MAARGVLRALAREFPGALRELDTVTLAEIDDRQRALAEAADTGRVEAWMGWMADYHTTMRAALIIKGVLLRSGDLSDPVVLCAKEEASQRTGLSIDDDFVRNVAHPPQGRLNRVVFERLGRNFGVSPDQIWQALFPARRVGRY